MRKMKFKNDKSCVQDHIVKWTTTRVKFKAAGLQKLLGFFLLGWGLARDPQELLRETVMWLLSCRIPQASAGFTGARDILKEIPTPRTGRV